MELVLTLTCPDQPGIVHAVTGAIANHGGNILESQQYGDATSKRFHMRVEAEGVREVDQLRSQLGELAAKMDMRWSLTEAGRAVPTIIMASKEGHCLSDLLYHTHEGQIPIDVVAVVANHEDLRPLAEFYHTPFHHIPVTKETKHQAEDQLMALLEETGAELIVLARYMQILSDRVCEAMAGRIINIHHSFLPSFKGARPYQQAHARGVKLIGATAHYVTPDLDEGPIIEQDVIRVTHADSVPELVSQGQDVERRVLSRAVRWHAQNRVLLNGHSTVVFS
ncbi:formyltetrahydrofolate deformylase [Actinomyces sp. F1_1611]